MPSIRDQGAVDEVLNAAVARGDVPGVVAAVTGKEAPIYEAAFGKRNAASGPAMTQDTVFWIASMTKAITATAAMLLVERGKLSLDAPAAEVLPRIGKAMVLEGFDAGETPRLRAPRTPVTLRQLLTHTAGFGYDMWSAETGRYQAAKDIPSVISCLDKALDLPLLFEPGTDWMYGINIDLAGLMVETVSGMKLGRFLSEHLFAPLGMKDTAFRISPDMEARRAAIHLRQPDDSLVPAPEIVIPQEPENEMGGGGLYGTISDYLRFIRMILRDGKADSGMQVLAEATVRQMSENNMGNVLMPPLKSYVPTHTNDVDLFPGMAKKWGLSFMINTEDAPTGRSAGSLAWAGLANTYFWIDRSKGIGGAYATQIFPFADKKSLPLFGAFETAVYAGLRD